MLRSRKPTAVDPAPTPAPALSRRCFLMLMGGTAAAGLAAATAGPGLWPSAAAATTPSGAGRLQTVSRQGRALGSEIAMTVLHGETAVAEGALDAAFAELHRVDEVMSLYRPNSQVALLNRHGTLPNPHPYLVQVLRQAQEMSRRSGGAFDVTVQPLWDLYAAAQAAGRLPDDAAIRQALGRIDWRKVQVSEQRLTLGGEGMAITLNGIAQGYAADRAVAALRRHGIQHALVNTGEIGTLGRKADEQPWTVGIQHPRQEDAYLALAKLDGRCMATSGDYATSFSADRARNHIFDPSTGSSPTTLSSVTVVAPTAGLADALSTALFVLGPERGLTLLQSRPGTDGLLVGKDGRRIATAGFPLVS